MESYGSDELQSALVDIQRYLLDQIPPLTASDAVETLMTQPPDLLMRQIRIWAVEQSRIQPAAMCDFIFHALRKVYLVSALRLVERTPLEAYLNTVFPLALQECPAEERETLRSNLGTLRDLQNHAATAVHLSTRGTAVAKPPEHTVPATDAESKSARRLSLVVERLSRLLPAARTPDAAAHAPAPEQSSQLVAMAASSARSEKELRAYIEKLRPYTGESDVEKLFHVLAAGVPNWDVAVPESAKKAAPIEAMHKIISLTPTAVESARRFRELITEAVAQFNSGALSAAVAMLELGDVIIAEKKLDPSVVERIRSDVVETITAEQLRKYAENKTKHILLRKALAFFPTLTTESLLQELRGEQRPERRRALLGLLEAYGAGARAAALAQLEVELGRPQSDVDTYYLRNLIYLLHRIVREPEESADKELELLARASARGQNIYVAKEAMLPLGQIKSEAAVKVLVMRIAEFEAILVRKDTSLYPIDEMQKLLDRIVAALARIATPSALLAIARHGMKPNPLLGDTRARLAALSQHDLSFDEQTVNLIVNTIREDLPNKLFGKVLPKLQPPPLRLIEALSSTRSEVVDTLFAEIVEKFPDHDVGRAARAALSNLAAAGRPAAAREGLAASLTGDLQFFGLPSLIQSLAETQATGIVTLTGKQGGQTAGKLLFLNGKFIDAQAGHLRGTEAMYQLLERPVVGTFAFVPQPATSVKSRGEPLDVMGLIFEGIRRHDELNQFVIFVPDDLCLKATAVKPTPDPDETDPAIVRDVWVNASSGARVAEWEPRVAADAFRVRRLLSRWIEEGALQPA